MIYYSNPRDNLSKALEYLPNNLKNSITGILFPKRLSRADMLLTGELNHPHFDMRSFIKSKSVFVHIPKAAGRSIRKQLYNGITCSHTTLYWYLLCLRNYNYRDFFIYTIVRNPWDRLHSAYHFLKKGGAHKGDQEQFRLHLSRFDNFEDFVLNLPSDGLPPIIHMKPMHKFLELRKGKSMINYVGYYEDLDESYAYISRRLGISSESVSKSQLCHENKKSIQIL